MHIPEFLGTLNFDDTEVPFSPLKVGHLTVETATPGRSLPSREGTSTWTALSLNSKERPRKTTRKQQGGASIEVRLSQFESGQTWPIAEKSVGADPRPSALRT